MTTPVKPHMEADWYVYLQYFIELPADMVFAAFRGHKPQVHNV
jgi:hypothetical protein